MSFRQFYKVVGKGLKINKLNSREFDYIKEELWKHGVIVLKEQSLTP